MGRRWIGTCLLILFLLVGAVGNISALPEMQVFYLDVGQAESTLLKGSDFNILIDAGDRSRSGVKDVADYLHRIGVENIDLLILTHPHADHIGQAPDILSNFLVNEVWMSGYEHSTHTFEKVLDAILESDTDYYEPRTGESFKYGELVLEVLNPSKIGSNLHATNIVVRAVYGDIVFLFTGDAERRTEMDILERDLQVQAQILQLGHHGSRTSSSLDFLLAVQPEVAIYSAGSDNDYGHPHAEVINRLRILEVPVYGTDVNDTIVVRTDGEEYGVHVSTEREFTQEDVGDERVELNEASLLELQKIIHVGPKRAEEIIELRQIRPFRSVDDLIRVSGLAGQRITEIKQQGLAYIKGVVEN